MKKIFSLFVALLIFCSCSNKSHYSDQSPYMLTAIGGKFEKDTIRTKEEYQASRQCIESFLEKNKDRSDLEFLCQGSKFFGDLETCALFYRSSENLNLDECRKLIVELAIEFADHVNSDETMKPFLDTYPLTIDKFDVTIVFQNIYDKKVPEDSIKFAELNGGILRYLNNANSNLKSERALKETFKDALRILHDQNMSPQYDPSVIPQRDLNINDREEITKYIQI